jgi:hypothetical protein
MGRTMRELKPDLLMPRIDEIVAQIAEQKRALIQLESELKTLIAGFDEVMHPDVKNVIRGIAAR